MAEKQTRTRGRPARGEFKGKSSTLTTRITPKTRAQLEKGTKKSSVSMSQYVEHLLVNALDKKWDQRRRSNIVGIAEAFAAVIETVERATGQNWQEDVFTSTAVVTGAQRLLSYFGPQGDLKVPEKVEKDAAAMERAPAGYQERYRTPEEIGHSAAGNIIHNYEISQHRDWDALNAMKAPYQVPDEWHRHLRTSDRLGSPFKKRIAAENKRTGIKK